MNIDYQTITAIALGVALSACCGFRIFIPLLAGAIAGHWGIVNLPADMQWLAGWPALICFSSAAIVEIGAYYFPFLDNILDTVATPLAIGAGTVLAGALIPMPDNEPMLRWVIAIIAGGGAAGTIQASTGLLRLFSTKATLGTGNSLIATGENAAAVTGSIFSFVVPVVVAAIIIVVVLWILFAAIKRLSNSKNKQL
jgi:Domain of unknown function (DUF4126)